VLLGLKIMTIDSKVHAESMTRSCSAVAGIDEAVGVFLVRGGVREPLR
jgi:hypothetical protein